METMTSFKKCCSCYLWAFNSGCGFWFYTDLNDGESNVDPCLCEYSLELNPTLVILTS